MYRPGSLFSVPMELLTPTYATVNGVRKKTFPASGISFFGSFKTYGGTETNVNGVYAVQNTANVETWFMPEIKAGCRIKLAETNAVYEIVGEPENIELRNQFLKIKVQLVTGGA